MSRSARIEHYLDRALDEAALVAALGLANSDMAPALERLGDRQDILLDEHIHQFALVARKLGELVERDELAAAAVWRTKNVLALRAQESDDPDTEFPLSLAQIANFVIHSDRFEIEREPAPSLHGNETRTSAAWTFVVQSDSSKEKAHLIYIDHWLDAFLQFEKAIRHDLPPMRLER